MHDFTRFQFPRVKQKFPVLDLKALAKPDVEMHQKLHALLRRYEVLPDSDPDLVEKLRSWLLPE